MILTESWSNKENFKEKILFICYESRCLKWQNWEQRQHCVKCSGRGTSGHGAMCCLTESTEVQWVQKWNVELQCWDCKQCWPCLQYRNLPAGPKIAYAYCLEMLLQIKWYATKANIEKAAEASELSWVPLCNCCVLGAHCCALPQKRQRGISNWSQYISCCPLGWFSSSHQGRE